MMEEGNGAAVGRGLNGAACFWLFGLLMIKEFRLTEYISLQTVNLEKYDSLAGTPNKNQKPPFKVTEELLLVMGPFIIKKHLIPLLLRSEILVLDVSFTSDHGRAS